MEIILLLWLIILIMGICLTIAPLIIWRNTNRTNILLQKIDKQLQYIYLYMIEGEKKEEEIIDLTGDFWKDAKIMKEKGKI